MSDFLRGTEVYSWPPMHCTLQCVHPSHTWLSPWSWIETGSRKPEFWKDELLGFSWFIQGERLYVILFGRNVFLGKVIFHFHFASLVHAVLLWNIRQIFPFVMFVHALSASSLRLPWFIVTQQWIWPISFNSYRPLTITLNLTELLCQFSSGIPQKYYLLAGSKYSTRSLVNYFNRPLKPVWPRSTAEQTIQFRKRLVLLALG